MVVCVAERTGVVEPVRMEALLKNAASEDGSGIKDMQNSAWAENKSGFGYKMLLKMGWKESTGLGKDGEGMTEHVKVAKRVDARGLGAEKMGGNNHEWTETAQSFTGVLATLNEKYGGASSSKKAKKDKKKTKDKDKKKRKRTRSSSKSDDDGDGDSRDDEESAEDDEAIKSRRSKGSKKDAKASSSSSRSSSSSSSSTTRRGREEEDGSGESEDGEGASPGSAKSKKKKRSKSEKKEEKKRRKKTPASSPTTSRFMKAGDGRPGRARFIQSKLLTGRSSKEMAAVLGVVTR